MTAFMRGARALSFCLRLHASNIRMINIAPVINPMALYGAKRVSGELVDYARFIVHSKTCVRAHCERQTHKIANSASVCTQVTEQKKTRYTSISPARHNAHSHDYKCFSVLLSSARRAHACDYIICILFYELASARGAHNE